MSLSADRDTPPREGVCFSAPVAAATTIFAGALVALDAAGNLVPGSTATTLIGLGRAEQAVDNSDGDAGDLRCEVRRGCFRWDNSAGADEITRCRT